MRGGARYGENELINSPNGEPRGVERHCLREKLSRIIKAVASFGLSIRSWVISGTNHPFLRISEPGKVASMFPALAFRGVVLALVLEPGGSVLITPLSTTAGVSATNQQHAHRTLETVRVACSATDRDFFSTSSSKYMSISCVVRVVVQQSLGSLNSAERSGPSSRLLGGRSSSRADSCQHFV